LFLSLALDSADNPRAIDKNAPRKRYFDVFLNIVGSRLKSAKRTIQWSFAVATVGMSITKITVALTFIKQSE
jgi:hypothetical protein